SLLSRTLATQPQNRRSRRCVWCLRLPELWRPPWPPHSSPPTVAGVVSSPSVPLRPLASFLVLSFSSVASVVRPRRSHPSAENGVLGLMISHAANARKPTSVAISCGYAVWPGSTCPPPPKQPQSIVRPRAHDCATAAMNPTSTTADTTAVIRVAAPSS